MKPFNRKNADWLGIFCYTAVVFCMVVYLVSVVFAILALGFLHSQNDENSERPTNEFTFKIYEAVLVFNTVFYSAVFLTSIQLGFGIAWKKQHYFLPWIGLSCCAIIKLLIQFIVTLLFSNQKIPVIVGCVGFAVCCIHALFLVAVMMKREDIKILQREADRQKLFESRSRSNVSTISSATGRMLLGPPPPGMLYASRHPQLMY